MISPAEADLASIRFSPRKVKSLEMRPLTTVPSSLTKATGWLSEIFPLYTRPDRDTTDVVAVIQNAYLEL